MDRSSGGGSIHNTPGIAFQEEVSEAERRVDHISIPKSNRRSITMPKQCNPVSRKIDPKAQPSRFSNVSNELVVCDSKNTFEQLLQIWKLLRYQSLDMEAYARFVGFVIKLYQKPQSKQTVMTYLPPIQTPITEYGTLVNVFTISQNLAMKANMKYAHITFDVGAAIKGYHLIWNEPELWKNIIIHLGDFHSFMAFFGVIGKFIAGSGFEEIIYQSGLCSSGSIKMLLSGKHYNRCWWVHETFSEALERLFIKKYLPEYDDAITNMQVLDSAASIEQWTRD